MCELPVFYATTEGQTRRIAERLSALLHERGIDSRAIDMTSADAQELDWRRVRVVAVGAPVYRGRHQPAIDTFVRRHTEELNGRPSAFFSVSLRAASPGAANRDAARQVALKLLTETGWRPGQVTILAGRLAYTKYGWLMRWVMKRIARKAGLAIDTSRDHEYTNWDEVARLADDLAAELHRTSQSDRLAS
ncbi:MAG: flavodoxin domain-containing protein [Acidobacteriota bacterium]